VHDAIDPELERGLRGVSHVLGVSKDAGTRCLIFDQHGAARDVKLVASGSRFGKALKGVPAVPQQILPLRRSRSDEDEETVVREDGTHGMEAWGAIPPNGGEKGQADVELKEQPATDFGQLRLRRREVLPRHHVILLLPAWPTSRSSQIVLWLPSTMR
jgi:hypothetical protein